VERHGKKKGEELSAIDRGFKQEGGGSTPIHSYRQFQEQAKRVKRQGGGRKKGTNERRFVCWNRKKRRHLRWNETLESTIEGGRGEKFGVLVAFSRNDLCESKETRQKK